MPTAFPVLPGRNRSRRAPVPAPHRIRPDIQGLRALAVTVVVLDHLIGWPSGGFIGVDIFFVISGFLITGLLLREYEKTGRISFGAFYRRRIKRIIPASLAAIIATVLGAFAIFGPSRFLETAQDGAAAALFGANWRFAALDTDYFRANVPVSPLQHFWSLSVEEQFYFVWPAVMLVVLALVTRRGGDRARARLGAGLVIGLISAASFAWALRETNTAPSQAYFSTFSRAWELGAGAALACAAPLCSRIAARVRPLLAWLGIGLMVAGLFLVSSSSAFPAPWALLPVLGAALVILAGTGTESHALLLPLTNPVSGYLGNISYSLYLWHFPVIILGGAVFLDRGPLFYVGCAAAMLLLAVLSYHLIEDPIRRSSWLSGRTPETAGTTTADGRAQRRAARGAGFRRAAAAAGVTAVMCAVTIPFIPAHSRSIQLSNTPAVDVSDETADLQEQIRVALRSSDWPELEPTIDEAINGSLAPGEVSACDGMERVDLAECTWGDPDATRRAVVVGDSMAVSWVSSVRKALGSTDGWSVTGLGTSGCTFTDVLIRNPEPELVQACEDRKTQAVDAINELQPDVVIIANSYEPRFPTGAQRALTPEEWKESTRTIVSRFRDAADTVVFLAPPPLSTDITDCYSKLAEPSFCAGKISEQWRTIAAAEQELAGELNGSFVSPELWFCAEGWCPSFVGSTPVMRDQVHMTPSYQLKIAPALRRELEDRGIVAF